MPLWSLRISKGPKPQYPANAFWPAAYVKVLKAEPMITEAIRIRLVLAKPVLVGRMILVILNPFA